MYFTDVVGEIDRLKLYWYKLINCLRLMSLYLGIINEDLDRNNILKKLSD